jgi:hypothetical protein
MGVLSSVRAVRWARKHQPEEHIKRIKLLQELGATTIVLMNVSGGDPHAAIRVYGESVLPELR